MPDPVSWLVIEPGWEVVDSGGQGVGKVHELVGDTGKDIFNGLAVSPGLLKTTRYVPAELVGTIVEGRVQLTISSGDFDRLEEHEEPPPSEQFRSA
jgi:hypothetical protein